MNDQSRVLAMSLFGAAIGGVAGYLYLTESGRRARLELEPRLDDLATEIVRLRTTLVKAQGVASEGWRLLTQMAGETPFAAEFRGGAGQSARY